MAVNCSKKFAALTWALLECMFFSSLVLGWTWLAVIFRNDGYFPQFCNITSINVTSSPKDVITGVEVMSDIRSLTSGKNQKQRPAKSPCRPRREIVGFDVDPGRGTRDRGSSDDAMLTTAAHAGGDTRLAKGARGDFGSTGMDAVAARRGTSSLTQNLPDTRLVESGHQKGVQSPYHSNDPQTVARQQPKAKKQMTIVVGYCLTQNENLRTMFAVVLIIRDLLAFPVGFFYDKYGTTRTRLLTVLVFALGTLMMTFTSASIPWLVVPALTMIGIAGSAVFLTNLQTANLFGRKRHLVISFYVGAAYSNGLITLLIKLTHFKGLDLQTSFMFLTIGVVPMLVSTVAFLPKTRVPWPLPADYGKRRNQSLDEAMLRKQRAWQRRMSEAGLSRQRRPPPPFVPMTTQSLFVWSVLWFSIQRVHEAVFETNVIDVAKEDFQGGLDVETYFGIIQILGVFLAPLAGLLIDRDPRPALGLTQATQHMQRIVPAIVLTSSLAVLEVITGMMTGVAAQGFTTFFNILHKVFTYTTMCSFVMHLHFNHQQLGKLYGLSYALSAVVMAFQFPIRTYLIKKRGSMFATHILLLILNLISLAHAVNAWDYCRKRLIKDQSDNSSERDTRASASAHAPMAIRIETDESNLPGHRTDGGPVYDPRENSTEISGVVISQTATSTEAGRFSATPVDGNLDTPKLTTGSKNGGSRIIFQNAFRNDDDEDYDDDDDDDDEEDDELGFAVSGGTKNSRDLQTTNFV